MNLTDLALPAAAYLLCHDPAKGRMGDDSALVRGQVLRAAAVAELRLAALLTDRDGKAVRAASWRPDDPLLRAVLDVVPPDGAKGWFRVVDHHWHTAEATVRESLAADGVIDVGRARRFGIVPVRTVTPTDPEQVRDLRARVRHAVVGGEPWTVPLREAVLAVIAVDADVRTVVSGREHGVHRTSIRALGQRVEAELPGLRKALSWSVAARRTGAA